MDEASTSTSKGQLLKHQQSMPNLKHLTCTVEWSGSAVPLQEFQTAYGDGYVQTYVAVPPIPTPFSIHLRSNGYIAPGLAMYVYIDGEYQCNRFRQNLRIPDGTTTRRQTEVDFHVRQKEEMLEDGTFEGKQWKFENLNIGKLLQHRIVNRRQGSLLARHCDNRLHKYRANRLVSTLQSQLQLSMEGALRPIMANMLAQLKSLCFAATLGRFQDLQKDPVQNPAQNPLHNRRSPPSSRSLKSPRKLHPLVLRKLLLAAATVVVMQAFQRR